MNVLDGPVIMVAGGRRGAVGPVGPAGPDVGRLAPAALQHSDWNTAITNGYHQAVPNTPNSPTTGLWYMGQVISHNATNYVEQIVHGFTTNDPYYQRKYRRQMVNGVWGDWQLVIDTPEVVVRAITGGGGLSVAANGRIGFTDLVQLRGGFYLGGSVGGSIGGNVVHVQRPGKYEVGGRVYKNANQPFCRAKIVRNLGGYVSFAQCDSNTAAETINFPTSVIDLSGGDHLSLQFDHASSVFLSPDHTEISLKYLG